MNFDEAISNAMYAYKTNDLEYELESALAMS